MANRIKQERSAQVNQTATALGASATETDEGNVWDVTVPGKHAGQIRYEPRARVWLATTGKESTIGDLAGCLEFVIHRC